MNPFVPGDRVYLLGARVDAVVTDVPLTRDNANTHITVELASGHLRTVALEHLILDDREDD